MTPHLDGAALAPEIVLLLGFLAVFAVDLVGPRARAGASWLGAMGALGGVLAAAALGMAGHHAAMLGGAYEVDSFALVAKGSLCTIGAVVLLLGAGGRWPGELVQLVLASVLGASLLASARDLLLFVVAFELVALPGYLLVGWRKTDRAAEAATKYFIQGVVATAIMLYGISLLYGLADGTQFAQLAGALSTQGGVALARIAVVMVLAGALLKVGAMPFHFWAPDAYEGAPVTVAAYLGVLSKVAGAVGLLVLVVVGLPSVHEVWGPVLWVAAATTMVFGNLVALRQSGLLRLLAWSSIAQTGYLLLPLAVSRGSTDLDLAARSTLQFVVVYAAMSLGAFAVTVQIVREHGTDRLEALRGLFLRRPTLAVLLSVCMLSLAGIPPFGGWYAKLVIFRAAVDGATTSSLLLGVVAAVSSTIGVVYYFQVIRRLWLDQPPTPADEELMDVKMPLGLRVALVLTVTTTVAFGVLPGIVARLGEWSSLAR